MYHIKNLKEFKTLIIPIITTIFYIDSFKFIVTNLNLNQYSYFLH